MRKWMLPLLWPPPMTHCEVTAVIAVCPNPFRDQNLELTRKTCALLQEAGYRTVICPIFAEDDPDILPDDIPVQQLQKAAPESNLCIVIGGDGTILAAVRQLQGAAIPILGVNLGTKGFMSALEPEDLPLVLEAARGDFTCSRRMMLQVSVQRNGQVIYTDHALNDVVLHGYGDCIQLTASCDGETITQFSGDGIVLATPTGSTGYSMSAGGPIVEPDAENILISPICAHMMGARSFVLDPRRCIQVKTEKLHGRRAYLSVDGNSVVDLENGDLACVVRSERNTLMANLGRKSFYELAYNKLR